MGAARFSVIVAAVLLGSFFGMKWLLTVQPLKPDARIPTFHRVDTDSPEYKLQQSDVSDNDPTRDRLRNEVLDYAKALAQDPCNDVLKKNYIRAVVAYARAWVSIAPCLGTGTCSNRDLPALDRARQAFGSPLDHRVRDAMQAAHAAATFGSGDFPQDVAHMVADLAADESLNSAAETREFRSVTRRLDSGSARRDCGG